MELKTKYNIGDRVYGIYSDDTDLKYYVAIEPKFIQDIRIDKEKDKLVVHYRVNNGLTMLEEDIYPNFEQARVGAIKRSINSVNNRIAKLKKDVEDLEKVLNTIEPDKPTNRVNDSSKKVEVDQLSFWLHLNTNSYYIEILHYNDDESDEYTCYVSNDSDTLWEWTFDSDGRTYADFPNNDISNAVMDYLFTKVFK
jgi:hypothetical protein